MSVTSPPETLLTAVTQALEAHDYDAFESLLAEDAEQISHSVRTPPATPARMLGRAAIIQAYREAPAELEHSIDNGVAGADRIAFTLTCRYPNGGLVVSNMIGDVRDGALARIVAVEAWDE